MFPIPWNFPLRKKNGNLVNIGDAIEEGTEIPEHTSSDEGKLLSVDENGDLEWSDEVNSEIQTLTNEVDTIVNDLSAKNIFDIDGWLNSLAITFTKNSNTYTIAPTISAVSTPFVFSDNDIDVTISGIITNVTSSGLKFEILNSSNTIVATINNSVSFASGKGCKVRLNWPSGGMGNFTIEKPMIRPASITSDAFVPYAMTNKELTEVAQQIESGYIIKTDKTKSLISVTADGVKTYGALFSELRTALLTYLANHTDEYCEILGVDTGAGLLPINSNSNALGKLYHSGDTLSIRFYGFAFADDGVNIRAIDVYSSSASYKRYFISQSQYTPTDSTDSIASSGTVLALHIRIYTKVS